MPDPDIATRIEELRARLTENLDVAELVRDAEARATEWRWASIVSNLTPTPFASEVYAGAPVRWLGGAPDAPGDQHEVGLDAQGRVVLVRARNPALPGYRSLDLYFHEGREIEGIRFDGRDQVVTRLVVELEEDGRPRASVTVHRHSYAVERYRWAGEDGRLLAIDSVVQIDELGPEPITSTYEMRYDGFGALAEILERDADGEVDVTYRARKRSKRAVRDALVSRVREQLLTALGTLDDPSGVTALCLQYEQGEPLPPWLTVLRDDRLRRDEVTLADFAPQEWRVPDGDSQELAGRGDEALAELRADGDNAADMAHDVLRRVVRGTPPDELQSRLGTRTPPLLFAMDLEQADAETNLRDALGASRAKRVLAS